MELGTKSVRGGEGKTKWNRGQGQVAEEGRLYLNICVGVPDFLATPLLMGPVCLLNRGRFEEPARP